MKRLVFLVVVAALCVPAAALAANPQPNATTLAAHSCKTQQTQMGATAFNALYKTYGACVSKAVRTANGAIQNASATCKAEQAADSTAFAAKYGSAGKSNGKGSSQSSDALGACVSSTTQAANDAKTSALVRGAKACKTERAAGAAAFIAKYHTFGACVSKQAKS